MSEPVVLWEGEVPRNEFGSAGTTWKRIFERGGQTIAEYQWHGIAPDEKQTEEDEASRLVAHLAREFHARDEALKELRAAALAYHEASVASRAALAAMLQVPVEEYERRALAGKAVNSTSRQLITAEARLLALLPAAEATKEPAHG